MFHSDLGTLYVSIISSVWFKQKLVEKEILCFWFLESETLNQVEYVYWVYLRGVSCFLSQEKLNIQNLVSSYFKISILKIKIHLWKVLLAMFYRSTLKIDAIITLHCYIFINFSACETWPMKFYLSLTQYGSCCTNGHDKKGSSSCFLESLPRQLDDKSPAYKQRNHAYL